MPCSAVQCCEVQCNVVNWQRSVAWYGVMWRGGMLLCGVAHTAHMQNCCFGATWGQHASGSGVDAVYLPMPQTQHTIRDRLQPHHIDLDSAGCHSRHAGMHTRIPPPC